MIIIDGTGRSGRSDVGVFVNRPARRGSWRRPGSTRPVLHRVAAPVANRAGSEASTTTNLNEDIYAFSKAVGLFGGGSLEGAAIIKRDELNDSYYIGGASPRSIVIGRKYFNAHADPLRNSLPR